MKKYDPKEEYKVNIEDEFVKGKIAESENLFKKYITEFGQKLDLDDKKTIKEAYQSAKNMGIFEKAQDMRELIFGKDMHFYGVSYLWDACVNHCAYCPGSIPNRKKAIEKGEVYPLRELSIDQAVEDSKAVIADGHDRICYLTGSAPGRERLPEKMVEYLKAFDKLGLNEIILNIEPATTEGFRLMRSAIKNTSLQFRIFQETYDRETYAKMHPKGPKADYDFRRESQARAIVAGIDNIGLGVLFGLHSKPLEEIVALKEHAEELEDVYGKKPARICLPSANELTNIGVKIPYFLQRGEYTSKREELVQAGDYEMLNELVYALARLAMPTINIVSSERDGPAMLEILDKYATCTTLNVHPGVGDNMGLYPCGETHFEQTTTFPREPKQTIKDMKERGYNPIFSF